MCTTAQTTHRSSFCRRALVLTRSQLPAPIAQHLAKFREGRIGDRVLGHHDHRVTQSPSVDRSDELAALLVAIDVDVVVVHA